MNCDLDCLSIQVRTSTPETREAEKKGLLWILDEEAIFPGATEDSFMDRFFGYHGEHKVKSKFLFLTVVLKLRVFLNDCHRQNLNHSAFDIDFP